MLRSKNERNLSQKYQLFVSLPLRSIFQINPVYFERFNHRCRRVGGWGAAALPTLEKFAKISHNRTENRPKIGQNFSKQWIFYRAAPLNFISPYAHGFNADETLRCTPSVVLRPYNMEWDEQEWVNSCI